MKKNWMGTAALAATVLLCGCVTSKVTHTPAREGQTGDSGRPVVANLKGSNNGLFLFYYIPLWTGSSTSPNRRDYECFENQLRRKYLERMLMARAEKLGADGIEQFDITSERSTGFFSLWLLWHREVSASAVAVK